MVDQPQGKKRLFGAVIIALLFLVVLAAAIPAFLAARRSAIRMQRANDLKQIGLGILTFDELYNRLPPVARVDKAGRPLSSWRFQITPFLEGFMIDVDYDARWDAPANRNFKSMLLSIYCWRGDDGSPESFYTNVVAVTGPGTAFEAGREVHRADLDNDTILAVEVANSGVHWMEPGDLDVGAVPPSIIRGLDGGGVHVLFADGSVWFLDADTPLDDIAKFFTIAGAKQFDREKILAAHGHPMR